MNSLEWLNWAREDEITNIVIAAIGRLKTAVKDYKHFTKVFLM
jgi:hypothetical protein